MKKKKKLDSEFIEVLSDLCSTLRKTSGIYKSDMANSILSTLADVLEDNQAFQRMLADPKTDLAEWEPVIKRMLKKKKRKNDKT